MSANSRARERKNGLELERRTLWDDDKLPHYSQFDNGAGFVITVGDNKWLDPVKFGATRYRQKPEQLIMLVVLELATPVVLANGLVKIIVRTPSDDLFGSGAMIRAVRLTDDKKYNVVELALLSKLMPVRKTKVSA